MLREVELVSVARAVRFEDSSSEIRTSRSSCIRLFHDLMGLDPPSHNPVSFSGRRRHIADRVHVLLDQTLSREEKVERKSKLGREFVASVHYRYCKVISQFSGACLTITLSGNRQGNRDGFGSSPR